MSPTTPMSMLSKDAMALLVEARASLKQEAFFESAEFFQQAIAVDPDNAIVFESLRDALVNRIQDTDIAVDICSDLVCRFPDNKQVHILANRFVRSVNPLSDSSFKKLLRACEGSVAHVANNRFLFEYLHFTMAVLCLSQGRSNDCRRYCQVAIKQNLERHNPDFVANHWEQGVLAGPDFLLLGFMKCGTTALFDYVSRHPNVLPGITKEPFFLQTNLDSFRESNSTGSWEVFERSIEFYKAHFPPRKPGSKFISGEASTSNIYVGVEQILAKCFPNVKLVVILRNPVDRAVSHYHHQVRSGNESRTLADAIESQLTELSTFDGEEAFLERVREIEANDYIVLGLYYYFLRQWMNVFPREQFLILDNDELNRQPDKTLKRFFDFFDLPEFSLEEYPRRNVGAYRSGEDPDVIERLHEFYQQHNEKLKQLAIEPCWC